MHFVKIFTNLWTDWQNYSIVQPIHHKVEKCHCKLSPETHLPTSYSEKKVFSLYVLLISMIWLTWTTHPLQTISLQKCCFCKQRSNYDSLKYHSHKMCYIMLMEYQRGSIKIHSTRLSTLADCHIKLRKLLASKFP